MFSYFQLVCILFLFYRYGFICHFVDILSIMENSTDKGTEYTSICCILIMMLISCTVIYHEMHKHGRKGSSKQTIKCAREQKAITAEFLLSYILPLFAFDFTLMESGCSVFSFFCNTWILMR